MIIRLHRTNSSFRLYKDKKQFFFFLKKVRIDVITTLLKKKMFLKNKQKIHLVHILLLFWKPLSTLPTLFFCR